jgi:hypothetical protein
VSSEDENVNFFDDAWMQVEMEGGELEGPLQHEPGEELVLARERTWHLERKYCLISAGQRDNEAVLTGQRAIQFQTPA